MIGRKLLRRLVLAAALPALMFTSAQSALAEPPEPVITPDPVELPAGVACPDFALRLEYSGGNLHVKEFKDENGDVVRTFTAGKGFILTFTNVDSGESVAIRTDGSVSSVTSNPDGTLTFTATGHFGFIIFPTDVPAGPATIVYTGRTVYNVDPDTGVFTLVSESGRQRDVCAELA
jgi:hypothetical protein